MLYIVLYDVLINWLFSGGIGAELFNAYLDGIEKLMRLAS